ncbi:MAG TPA: FGGY family carbohydrate kinase, partial [Thermoleophilia bacterium]|nr:FGGY family carbohydrate kinase [Thermoleophilia bacterium]
MADELVLGIDVGSTTSKAALLALDGRVVALEEMAHSVSRPRPGWAEQDPETVWWADVVELCRRLLGPGGEGAGGGGRVVAAAASALG